MPNNIAGLVRGLHHISLVTADQELNRRFYTEVLGLRRVKLTVNQDDPFHRHLFYADEKGTTGTAITFFEWPELPRGQVGLGSPHHLSYLVKSVHALPEWGARLRGQGVSVAGPFQRDDRLSLYLRDPDGVLVEITARNPEGVSVAYLREREDKGANGGDRKKEGEERGAAVHDDSGGSIEGIKEGMRLIRFDHASPLSSDSHVTRKFLEKLVGLESFSERPNHDQDGTSLFEAGTADNPGFLKYLTSPSARTGMVGRGNIHHIAVAVEEDEDQLRIKRSLDDAGIGNSGVVDRFWFRSLYFRDPDYNLLEIATKKPGYGVDEAPDKLGTSLVLPRWLEGSRGRIEAALKETDGKGHTTWPPRYEPVLSPPESLSREAVGRRVPA
jgi:glyoxalase family protein